jgi:hypothetical protein
MSDFTSTKNEYKDEDSYGYFPFEYFTDFLKLLHENKDIIEIITYDDLPWENDFNYENNYSEEYKNWKLQLKNGTRDDQKIYVLIQHDVDSSPERSMAVIREEDRLGIPSNIMIFNRRVNRKYLKNTGMLDYTDYSLDYTYLKLLQDQKRFVIAYHLNAFEQALFDKDEALRIFESDVKALRTKFNIDFFSPHGGPRSPDGFSNNILSMPEPLRTSIRWVHNRNTVRFDGEYSDGGPNNPKRDPARRDLRDFVRNWEKGKRYRVLIHPQYYHTPCRVSPRFSGTPWYDDLLEFYSSGKGNSAWSEITFKAHDASLKERISRSIHSLKNRIRRDYVNKLPRIYKRLQ